jgi:tRNA-dihydrouridine synthase 2
MRLLALSYGCDTVWGEELVDRRVMATTRAVNKELGTVEWRSNSNGAIAFQTCALEKDKVVFQLGTSNDVNAVKAASQVAGDVAAIDVNMGCPKHFSISGGMGAALLSTPDIAMGIIKALKRNVQIPVTAKIRALDSIDKTVEFCRRLESAGVSAISLHCRQRSTSPKHPADWSILGHAVSAVQVPIIANGDIYTREDMVKVKEVSSCSSVMLARPALLNCSVFDKSGKLQPRHRVICDYLKLCLRYEHHFKGTKYTVGEMVAPGRHPGEFLQKVSSFILVESMRPASFLDATITNFVAHPPPLLVLSSEEYRFETTICH